MSDKKDNKVSVRHFVPEKGDQVNKETKIFNDPIHGHIELHPLLVKVIDTPQFQRLRNIKQLGGNYFVYPGASHNRFEHCIGTCHLAGKLARHLQEIHPEKVDGIDILCVELAGLCHDLGHGPFSHMFDMKFLPKANPNTKWTHERGSCDMLDYLIEDNDLEKEFIKHKLKLPTDITFIKEMIYGPLDTDEKKSNGHSQKWLYKGRDRNKSFLYEIVSNERNKVDVDKWDYFARDCYHLGIKNSFDHNRFMKFLRVLTVAGENPQICARDKEAFSLYDMFHVRASLHRDAYQHKCKIAVESMICDAMLLADKHIRIRGKNGEVKMSQTIDDPVAFSKLSDHVFYQILYSTDPSIEMTEARNTLQRILRRDLYTFVGGCKPEKGKDFDKSPLVIQEELAEFDSAISSSDVIVNIKKFNYGMKDRNPCDLFHFYSKQHPDVPYQIRKEEVSHMLPDTFQDCEMLVHCKREKHKDAILTCLVNWCTRNGYKSPNTLDNVDATLTPMKEPNKRRQNGSDECTSAKKMQY